MGSLSVSEFRRTAAEPSSCFGVSPGAPSADRPRRGALLLDFSSTLSLGLIDLLLGGTGNETPGPSRSLTTVQRRLLEMIAAAIAEASDELDSPGVLGEDIAAVRLDVQAGQARGVLRLGAPLSAAEALGRRLQEAMAQTAALQVELPQATANRAELERLAVGDVIDTELPADAPVHVMLRGQWGFLGRLGLSNGQRAVRLTQKAPPAQGPPPPA